MTEQPPLDPDEIACPKCGQPAGQICRQPNAKPARTVHMERRRAAAHGGDPVPEAKPKRTPRPGKSNLTDEGRRKGAAASAQARTRRRKELEAETERRRAEAEQRAIEENAQRLADDAARYANDRAIVRRQVLDAAIEVGHRLQDAAAHVRRPRAFEDGQPVTTAVERVKVDETKTADGTIVRTTKPVLNEDGSPVVDEQIDLIGWYTVDHVATLTKAAAQAIATLRLEEGKPTGISEVNGTGGVAAKLGEAGTAELLKAAAEILGED